ncbi:GNAT family N-acetyltransferase [Piscinibacter sakaiensis]|uniref:GNAT family N-acetyltransferase n=1 Tax=Piscinibacter sakaiensis TaxID=1547922 RepID=UPI001E2ECC77|nr:GNAT family N-acetyltransferase [Piscinibacter sakaiensis]
MTALPTAVPQALETPRLRLVRWRDEHRAPFAALNADPEVMRHFPAVLTREQSDRAVDRLAEAHARRGFTFWATELRETGEFIGFVGLLVPAHDLPFQPCVEIGWRLARAHWGRGYATEGAQAALDLAFGPLGLAEVVSMAVVANAPSRAVMARLGMRDTGRDFDHPAVPDGPLKRHVLYAIDRAAWGASRLHTPRGGEC